MASEDNKRFQRALAPALKRRGFKKSGASWRRNSDDAIEVVNLQGSKWGNSFYINLGAFFRALGDRDSPCEYHCHIRTRLGELVPDRGRLNALLDFEKSMPEGVRESEVESLVVAYGLPWLEGVSTLAGAREFCRTQSPKSPWITKELRTLFAGTYGA